MFAGLTLRGANLLDTLPPEKFKTNRTSSKGSVFNRQIIGVRGGGAGGARAPPV